MGLRTTDNINLDPSDGSGWQHSPSLASSSNPLLPAAGLPEGAMESLIQLFREKSDAEIAMLVPGTTAAKAADIRAMLSSAGLL